MSTIKRGGLGRGLNALFEDEETPAFAAAAASQNAAPAPAATAENPGAPRRALPVSMLHPGQFQPRQVFDDATIKELSESIATHGILQPLLVRPLVSQPGHYEIIGGERRWRAAQKAQLHEVPVIIRELSDEDAMQIALIENLQREDLNPIDEAEAYQRLMEEFAHTQEKLASIVGKSRSHVANTVRLLNLPKAIRAHIRNGKLTAGHARALITAADPEALATRVIADGLSVRETERLAQQAATAPAKGAPIRAGKDSDTLQLERDLTDRTGLKVRIDSKPSANGTKGTVKIEFKSLDDLETLISRITSGTPPL